MDTTGFTTVRMTPTATEVQDVLDRVRQAAPEAHDHVTAQGTPVAIGAGTDVIVKAITVALPAVVAAIAPIIQARKVTISSATTAITAISSVVATLTPQLKGADARALVIGLFNYIWDTYLVTLLPAILRPFGGFIKGAAVGALQTAYDTVVKKTAKS